MARKGLERGTPIRSQDMINKNPIYGHTYQIGTERILNLWNKILG